MTVLYSLIMLLVCALVFFNSYRVWMVNDARRRGKLPKQGKATMFDVRRLLLEGEKEVAIQLYTEIFNTTPMRAKKDVEELLRSLKV